MDEKEIRAAFDETVGSGKVVFYDHWGSLGLDNLLSKIRYMVKAMGARWICLDHLAILVSGVNNNDERKLLDYIMTCLRSMVEELGIGLIACHHLRRPPEGAAHEEGAKVSLSHLRSSGGVSQLADMVIAMERNQQSETKQNETVLRVLKNRWTGETGKAGSIAYNPQTGRLTEWMESEEEALF